MSHEPHLTTDAREVADDLTAGDEHLAARAG